MIYVYINDVRNSSGTTGNDDADLTNLSDQILLLLIISLNILLLIIVIIIVIEQFELQCNDH